MYFYVSKTNKNEPIKLLEMCADACINFRNGGCIQRLTQNTQMK